MTRPLTLTIFLALAALLLAAPATAEEPLQNLLRLRVAPGALGAAPVIHGSERGDQTRFSRLPRIGLNAGPRFLDRLGVYASGRGLTVRRQGTVYDVEGGAAFKVAERVALTSSWRVVGYDVNQGSLDLGEEIAGPFFGVALSY